MELGQQVLIRIQDRLQDGWWCVCVLVMFNESILLAAGFAVTCCAVHDDSAQWHHSGVSCAFISLTVTVKVFGAAVKVEHVPVT